MLAPQFRLPFLLHSSDEILFIGKNQLKCYCLCLLVCLTTCTSLLDSIIYSLLHVILPLVPCAIDLYLGVVSPSALGGPCTVQTSDPMAGSE